MLEYRQSLLLVLVSFLTIVAVVSLAFKLFVVVSEAQFATYDLGWRLLDQGFCL